VITTSHHLVAAPPCFMAGRWARGLRSTAHSSFFTVVGGRWLFFHPIVCHVFHWLLVLFLIDGHCTDIPELSGSSSKKGPGTLCLMYCGVCIEYSVVFVCNIAPLSSEIRFFLFVQNSLCMHTQMLGSQEVDFCLAGEPVHHERLALTFLSLGLVLPRCSLKSASLPGKTNMTFNMLSLWTMLKW